MHSRKILRVVDNINVCDYQHEHCSHHELCEEDEVRNLRRVLLEHVMADDRDDHGDEDRVDSNYRVDIREEAVQLVCKPEDEEEYGALQDRVLGRANVRARWQENQ